VNTYAQSACAFNTTVSGQSATFSHIWPLALIYTLDSVAMDFGDGNNIVHYSPVPASTTHTYANSGTYIVCLTRYISQLGVNQPIVCLYCDSVTIGNPNFCIAAAAFTPSSTGLNASFVNNSLCNGCVTTSYNWDFGDGNTSSMMSPTHTYAAAGTYNACLTVTGIDANQNTCIDSICLPIQVGGSFLPCNLMQLSANYSQTTTGLTANFTNSTSCNTCMITTYNWDFGDGNTSTATNPSHTYVNAGTYNVCLQVIGIDSMQNTCIDSFCTNVTVSGSSQAPCNATANYTASTTNLTANFTNTSSCVGCVTTNYYWSFGDGGTSTQANPSHTYGMSGTYSACLVVTGIDSMQNTCIDSFCSNIIVSGTSQGPCAVSSSWTQNVSGLNVSFSNTSTCNNCSLTNYYWWFGDGNFSTLANPTHTYAAAGNYTVCLTAYGMDSLQQTCFDSVCAPLGIQGGTGINDISYNVLKLYPNPTSGNINIDLPLNEEAKALKIYDVSGRSVLELSAINQRKSIEIKLGQYSEGIYFLRLQTDKQIYTSSFRKE